MSKGLWLALASLLFLGWCYYCAFVHNAAPTTTMPAVSTSTTAPAANPSLQYSINNGQVVLNGVLPDEASKAAVIARANELYGAGKYTDNLKVQANLNKAAWVPNAPAILPALKDISSGGLKVENGEIIATGQVANDDIRLKTIRDLEKAVSPNLKVIDRLTVGNLTAEASKLQVDLNQQLEGKTIEFETNSDVILPTSKTILDQVSEVLKTVPATPIEVGGHADNRGNPQSNMRLSERRANSVLKYLTGKGIEAKRLSAKGFGDTKPIADNATPEGQLKNRRIEFRVKAN